MYRGDRSRKETLVNYGFRLPSALDNRPLQFEEFRERVPQTIYVSATPGHYELEVTQMTAEQIIRPTGLLDPEIIIRPASNQVDDLLGLIRQRAEKNERVLVTTLTKIMAENLTEYYSELNVRVRYMHSDIKTIERMEIIRDLRLGLFDVLVGINLLREGLTFRSLPRGDPGCRQGGISEIREIPDTDLRQGRKKCKRNGRPLCGQADRIHQAYPRGKRQAAEPPGGIQPPERHYTYLHT